MHAFADDLATLEALLRQARRALPAPSPPGPDWRQWAADRLIAEVKHATDDFWRSAHAVGAGLLFDSYQRDREARPFRFAHEVRAREAWEWLSALNMHEADKNGPWATWRRFGEAQRAAWRIRWFRLARGFLQRMRAYREARRLYECGAAGGCPSNSARRSTRTAGSNGLSSLGRSRISIGR